MTSIPLPLVDGKVKTLYRYHDFTTADGVVCRELVYTVVRETPRGYWISDDNFFRPRFVLKSGRKRFAYANKDQAFRSFQLRKKRQVSILRYQLERAEAASKLTHVNHTITISRWRHFAD